MLVAVPVIPHGAALSQLQSILTGHIQHAVLGFCGLVQQLHRRHRLADVAAAGGSHRVGNGVLPLEGQVAALLLDAQGTLHGGTGLLRRQGLELEHRAAGQQGVIDVEIGILGGAGDHGDLAVLQKLQQALLLLLVEVLDLIQIQQNAIRGHHGIHVGDDGLDIRQAGGGGVEMVQRLLRPLGDDVGNGGLSRAGRAVEDQIGFGPVFDQAAQQRALAQQMLLPCHLVQCLGPYFVCQRPHALTS